MSSNQVSYDNDALNNQITALAAQDITSVTWRKVASHDDLVLNTCLTWLQSHHLAYCNICRIALSNSRAWDHMIKKHKSQVDGLKEDEKIQAAAGLQERAYTGVYTKINQATQAQRVFAPSTVYLRYLPIHQGCFKCRFCLFVNKSRKAVRTHINKLHPEHSVKQHAPGKAIRSDNVVEGVPLQMLSNFTNNVTVTWIPTLPEVITPSSPPPEDNLSRTSFSAGEQARSDAMKMAYLQAERQRKLNAGHSESNTGNARLLDSFRKKSNILAFLSDKDATLLLDLIERHHACSLPPAKAYNLHSLEAAVVKYMDKVHDQIDGISLRLRQLLHSEDSFGRQRDMKDFMRLDSPERYFRVFARLISWIIRVMLIKLVPFDDADGIEDDTAPYRSLVTDIYLHPEVTQAGTRLLAMADDWEQLYHTSEDTHSCTEFEDALTDLSYALLHRIPMTTITNHMVSNIVVCYFFVSCIDKNTKLIIKNMLTAGNILSAIIYNARLMFLGYYTSPKRVAALTAEELETTLEHDIAALLNNTSKNYFEALVVLRPYVMELGNNYESEGRKVWEPQPDVMEFQGVRFPLQDIKKLMHSIATDLELTLCKDLLLDRDINSFGIDFGAVDDSPAFEHIGESVLDAPAMSTVRNWALDEISNRKSRLSRMLIKSIDADEAGVEWRVPALLRYLDKIKKFTALLACAVNLFSGGPLRGTELNMITYKNTANTKRSMIYNCEYRVWIVGTRYSKTNNVRRSQRLNSRILPTALSRIILVFIATVLPIRDWLYKQYMEQPDYDNAYLFSDGARELSSRAISNRLKAESLKFFTEGFGIKAWRQLINQIIKSKLNFYIYGDGDPDAGEEEDIVAMEDKQAGRTTAVSHHHYLNPATFSSLTLGLKESTLLTEFSKRYFSFWELTTGLEYGGSVDASTEITQYERVGRTDELMTVDRGRLKDHLNSLYRSVGRSFINPEQEKAIQGILIGKAHVTYISPTGSGKSLAYLLPAFVKKSTLFLVITPRVALRQDLIRKARELGLAAGSLCEALSMSQNLIFADVEDLDTAELDTLVASHKGFGRDVTVVLDEVHLLLLEINFRPKLRRLSTIVRSKPNLALISATLPTQLLDLLYQQLHIGNRHEPPIRRACHRPDIRYVRRWYVKPDEEGLRLTETMLEIDDSDGDIANKCLIFINNKTKAEGLASRLHIPFVFAGKQDTAEVLAEFCISRSNRYLITTSLLEVGVDLACIRYTITTEPMWSLLSIVQSSGRIRKAGTSYFICRQLSHHQVKRHQNAWAKGQDSISSPCNSVEDFRKLDKAYYVRFQTEQSCLRLPIAWLMDGNRRQCGQADALCSLCEVQEQEREKRALGETAENRAVSREWLGLQEKVADWRDGYCTYCLLDPYNAQDRPYSHGIAKCAHAWKDNDFKRMVEKIRKLARRPANEGGMHPDLGCHGCLFPKNLCNRLSNLEGMEYADDCAVGELLKQFLAAVWMWKSELPDMLKTMFTDEAIPDMTKLSGDTGLDLWMRKLLTKAIVSTLHTTNLIAIIAKLSLLDLIEAVESWAEDISGDDGDQDDEIATLPSVNRRSGNNNLNNDTTNTRKRDQPWSAGLVLSPKRPRQTDGWQF